MRHEMRNNRLQWWPMEDQSVFWFTHDVLSDAVARYVSDWLSIFRTNREKSPRLALYQELLSFHAKCSPK